MYTSYKRRRPPVFRRRKRVGMLQTDWSLRGCFSGKQGGFYDWRHPSVMGAGKSCTLYQDSTGATPVTALEQPVGLVLDSRYGLVRGSELRSTGVTALVGAATAAAYDTATGIGSVTRVDASNQSYVTFNVGVNTAAEIVITNTGANGINIRQTSAVGAFPATVAAGASVNVKATALADGVLYFTSGNGTATFTISSVKTLPGNHLIQPAATARPVLSARYNLLTKTEQFDDAAWVKGNTSVTANVSGTADKLIENTTNAVHRITQSLSGQLSGAPMVFRARLQAAELTWASVWVDGESKGCYFDLGNGAVGTATSVTPSITAVGDGSYWCEIRYTSTITAPVPAIYLATGDGGATFAGTGTTRGILVHSVDFRLTIDTTKGMPAYQRVNTSSDYDYEGFPLYLKPDGADDFLYSASTIDFTGTDKMTVIAGVTKLSDAAVGVVAELSAIYSGNTGSFAVLAPGTAAANYGFYARRTGNASNIASAYAAPISSVISCGFDMSVAAPGQITPRVNGATPTQAPAGDSGVGPFGNHTLYVGARAGTSLRFGGRIFPFAIVGGLIGSAAVRNFKHWLKNNRMRGLVAF